MSTLNLIVDTGTPPDTTTMQKGVAHINVSVMAQWGISIGDLVSFSHLPQNIEFPSQLFEINKKRREGGRGTTYWLALLFN